MDENKLRNKYYCELYQLLINDCIQTNKEVFGQEHLNFCSKYVEPHKKLCKYIIILQLIFLM